MLSKRTSKNQLTLPKKVVEAVGNPVYFDAAVKNGRIVLTPVHIGAAEAVRARLRKLGISIADVKRATTWARRRG